MSVRMYVCMSGFGGNAIFTGLELSYRFQTFRDYSFEASLLMDVFILVYYANMNHTANVMKMRQYFRTPKNHVYVGRGTN